MVSNLILYQSPTPTPQGTPGLPPHAMIDIMPHPTAPPLHSPPVNPTLSSQAGSLAHKSASIPDRSIAAFRVMYALIEYRSGTKSQSHIKRLEKLPLLERSTFVICMDTLTPHIQNLWGTQFVVPSFYSPTPKYGKFLDFTKGYPGQSGAGFH